MNTLLLTLAGIAGVGILFVLAPIATGIYRKYRGTFRVSCPETHERTSVEVDVGHAVISGLFRKPSVRLNRRSRWPERHDCDQHCREQIS